MYVEKGVLPKGTWWVEVHYNKDYGKESRLSFALFKVWVDIYWDRRKHYDSFMYWWTFGLCLQYAPGDKFKRLISGCFYRASFETMFQEKK